MKTNLWKMAAALCFGAAALVGCDLLEQQDSEPTFPEKIINNNVTPGEKLSITFTPNYDWEICVPAETYQWFWLENEDEDQKYDKISGKASETPVTVLVCVNETEEFDQNRSVSVSMTMNNIKQTVAEFMRPAKQRAIAVYAAELDEWGFKLAGEEDSGIYKYSNTSAESFTLVWPEEKDNFMMPVKLEANCEWTMTYPEWLRYSGIVDETLYGKAGVLEFRFEAIPSKYPINGGTGEIILASADDQSYTKTIEVTIPPCTDRIDFGLYSTVASPLKFNAESSYTSAYGGYSEGPALASLTATSGARVFAVAWNPTGYYEAEEATWVMIDIDEWDGAETADMIQEREVQIAVAQNEGEERKAMLFFLPENLKDKTLDDLFNDTGDAILDDYQKYAIELVQEAKKTADSGESYITISGDLASVMSEFKVCEESWLAPQFEVPAANAYQMTYGKIWGSDEARMTLASPCTTYEIFNADNNRVAIYNAEGESVNAEGEPEESDFWLSLNVWNGMPVINVKYDQETKDEGFVKFLDEEGNALAVVWFTFDPDFTPSGSGSEGGDIKFIGEMANYADMVGASIVPVTEGEYYNTYAEYGCPIYKLSYTESGYSMPMSINVPEYQNTMVIPEAKTAYFKAEKTDGGATISMQPETPDSAVIAFIGGSGAPCFILVCEYAL